MMNGDLHLVHFDAKYLRKDSKRRTFNETNLDKYYNSPFF